MICANRVLVVCDPADELQRTYEWVRGCGMPEETASPLALVDMDVQSHAHVVVE